MHRAEEGRKERERESKLKIEEGDGGVEVEEGKAKRQSRESEPQSSTHHRTGRETTKRGILLSFGGQEIRRALIA